MMEPTVLAHLTMKLTPQRENAATEALAFVLNRSATARKAVHETLRSMGMASEVMRVTTQHIAGEESRPDLALLASDGSIVGFIEVKFWAGLTDAQPVDYLRRLGDQGGCLLFLAPERRLPSLRAEIVERCRGTSWTLDIAEGSGLMVCGPNRVLATSWSALLSAIENAVARDNDASTLADVRQLRGLCEALESTGFIPLSRQELDDLGTPHRMTQLIDLAHDISSAAVHAKLFDPKGYKTTHYTYASGRYVGVERAGCWIGFDMQRWSKYGRSPIWMRFSPTDWGRAAEIRPVFEDWLMAMPERAFLDEQECLLIPVPLRAGVSRDGVVKAAVEFVRSVYEKVASAGLSDPSPASEPPEGD
ncbi:MAG: hypothetical protein ACOC9T_01800 [Myxococcota bacterium]